MLLSMSRSNARVSILKLGFKFDRGGLLIARQQKRPQYIPVQLIETDVRTNKRHIRLQSIRHCSPHEIIHSSSKRGTEIHSIVEE
jgi:hypothetical protein